jgi:YD repeat-containing protein
MNRQLFSGFFFLWTAIWSQAGFAQDTTNTIGNVSIASPTAASLGKYGDIPVSYNTGIPNISIPIYTVKAGSLSLPVSLSYHGSGLKVQEEASWVGAGWALNAGGVITRTVVGAADDQGVGSANICTNGHYSSYGYSSYLFVYDPGAIGAAYDGYWPDDILFCQGFRDAEPDLFFFNFGGYSGKFYFNDDRTPVFVPEEDFKVTPTLVTGPGNYGFEGFVMTTPDGAKYYFGETDNYSSSVQPIEISIPSTVQNGPANSNTAVSSWYLNKIVSADGIDSITFSYAQEQYSEYSLSMFPLSNITTNTVQNPLAGGYGLIKTFIQGVRLTGIKFPNGQLTFTRSASPRSDLSGYSNQAFADEANDSTGSNPSPSYSLGSIEISNSSGFCQKDSLYFDYFHDNVNGLNGLLSSYTGYSIQSDTYRLRLDSLKETSCDGTVSVPPYKFSYYSELAPRKLSLGIDHWGFYNGVTSNQGLVPTYSLTNMNGIPVQVLQGANRDASWPAMRGGALNQITYPTGGYTNFTFEPNTTWVNATNYESVMRDQPSAGYSSNGGIGNPDTSDLTSVGNSYQIIMENTSEGGSGYMNIYAVGSYTPTYSTGTVAVNLTDTFYTVLPAGNYLVVLTKNDAVNGYGIQSYISEMVPVSYTGNDTVGGLRIKTITNYDAISPDSVMTSYTYTPWGGTQSSGILYSRPVYVQQIRNDVYGWVYEPINGTPGCIGTANYYMSPTSISPMSTIQGNHIGYNEVDVTQPGNGHTTYRYYGSPYWDNIISDVCTRSISLATCTTAIPNFPAAPLPFEPMRGELEYVGQFNQAGQVLKDVSYTPVYVFDSLVTPALKYIDIPGLYSNTAYSLQSAKKVQTTTVSTIYDPSISGSTSTTSTVYYGSNYHHQPTRQVTTTSTGDSLATNTVYSLDFRVSSCDAIPDSLPYYINSVNADTSMFFADIGIPVASNWQGRMDTLSNMRRHVSLSRVQYLNYRLRSFSGSGNQQATCYARAENSADTALKPILRLQDEFQILPIETSQWRDNRLIHATFDKYDTSLNPVGFVYPDRTQLINLQALSGTFAPAAVSGSTIVKDSRYLDETLYQFSTGNPQQVTPHSGITNAYIWDYQNQEPIAKATNSSVSQIAYTSFEANGSGSWMIGSSARDTGSITGAQCYNLTNGACSRSGLTSTNAYVVSYWSKTGSSYTVSGSTAVVQGKTIGGWTYFEHTVSGVSTLTVSGAGDIDELRLYPTTAQMTTFTYTPLVGMTSQCDADNRVTYYQYDALGRMKVVLDQDHNVIKTVQYHYQGQ